MLDPYERPLRAVTRALVSVLVAALGVAVLVGTRPATPRRPVRLDRPVPIGQTTELGDGSGMVAINDALPGNVPNGSTPYPSVAPINGLAGTVSNVVLRINGFTHASPGDVDIMLVAPGGKSVVVMSDTGGGLAVSNVNLVFDDASSNYFDNLIRSPAARVDPDNFGIPTARFQRRLRRRRASARRRWLSSTAAAPTGTGCTSSMTSTSTAARFELVDHRHEHWLRPDTRRPSTSPGCPAR